jgi:DNA-binding GntR family transcriptional regulator
MDADSRKIPSHEVTYARLRDMILFGHLAPGAPVTIQGLIADRRRRASAAGQPSGGGA